MATPADEFVTQAREHLAVLEQVFLSLEGPGVAPDVRERVDRSLRLVHSIKGDAGFLGYTSIRARCATWHSRPMQRPWRRICIARSGRGWCA